jgi:signal transduction histidine kinase/HAMP domain-containing protein
MSGGLRQRFMLVIGALAAVIIFGITAIAMIGAQSIVDAFLRNSLAQTARADAQTFSAELDSAASSARVLAAALSERDVSPTNALWRTVSTLLDDPANPISRIGVIRPFRDGYQVVLFRSPDMPGGVAPVARIIKDELTPLAQTLFDARETALTGAPRWMGPMPPYRPINPEQVLIAAQGFTDHLGQPAGVVWIEIPLSTAARLLESISEGARDLAYIASGDGGAVIGRYPAHSAAQGDAAWDAALTAARSSSATSSTVLFDSVLFGAPARPVFAAAAPLGQAEGWQLARVIPAQPAFGSLTQTTLGALIVAVSGVIAVIAVTRALAGSALASPLAELTQAAQEIGSGDMRYQIDHQGRTDEIGRLARALEDMKRNLAQSAEMLQTWSRTLENRVTERTLALDAAQKLAQNTANELRAVYNTSLAVSTEYDLTTILNKLTEQIPALLSSHYCGVWLLNGDRAHMRLVATTPEHHHIIGRLMPSDRGLAGTALQSRQPAVVDSYPNWDQRYWTDPDPNLQRMIAVPLLVANEGIGAVVASRNFNLAPYGESEVRLLSLMAALVAPIIRNAQLIAQLDEAVKRAESASAVKTRFLASVTHELRTPLNLVINNMDFMRVGMFGQVTDEQREKLDQTIRSAEHLLYLINDLLDVSKIEAGEMNLFMQPTELYPLIEDALDATVAQLGSRTKVALQLDLPESLPTIDADARRLRQILLNLLSNAVKFTREGEVRLRVSASADSVVFEVTDTGIGIAPEDQEQVFEMFHRTNQVRALGIEGTGLGLAISRYLAQAHGGSLTLQSQPGVGSTFTLTLPITQKMNEK